MSTIIRIPNTPLIFAKILSESIACTWQFCKDWSPCNSASGFLVIYDQYKINKISNFPLTLLAHKMCEKHVSSQQIIINHAQLKSCQYWSLQGVREKIEQRKCALVWCKLKIIANETYFNVTNEVLYWLLNAVYFS